MFGLGSLDIKTLILRAVAVLLAISVHEASHGLCAYLLGDRTAKYMGRISINPMRHIDPIGALCLLVFGFGWAKPVMVNSYRFKNPKLGMSFVGLGGPLANFILAIIGGLVVKILYVTNCSVDILWDFMFIIIAINVGLGVFNLIPIPPLDGSKIFLSLLPSKLYYDIMRYEHIGWILLVVALGLGVLDPILGAANGAVLRLIFFLVGVPVNI